MARAGRQVLIALTLFLAACNVGTEPVPAPVIPAATQRVLVACEGSLGNGNSALTVASATSDSAAEDAYAAANGAGLGDIFQSITPVGDRLFLCINNSDQILVVGRQDLRLQGRMSVSKPRYIVPVSATKAYVSRLFSNQVAVIDLQTLQVTGSVTMPCKNSEGMTFAGNRLYVCTRDTACRKLYALDPATDAVADSLPVGAAPQEVLADAAGRLWVLAGNDPQGVAATWTCLDPGTKAVVRQFSFGNGIDAIRPAFNKTADTLYWIQVAYDGSTARNGVYRMSTAATALPATAFVAAQALQYFWAVGVDPRTGLVYIGDPKGFTQRGVALVYNPQGALVRSFKTGVGPGHFYFD